MRVRSAWFALVTVTGCVTGPPLGASSRPVRPTAAAIASVSAGPPAPWQGRDIGEVVTATGRATCVPSSCRFTYGGREIGGTADAFYFAYQRLRGDGQITARIEELDALPNAKAGLMVRGGLEPGAPNVFAGLLADPESTLLRVQRRGERGGGTAARSVDVRARRVWVRLVRKGTSITVLRGPDVYTGPPWKELARFDLALPEEAFFGLAMEAHGDAEPAVADFLEATVDNLIQDESGVATWTHWDVGAIGGSVRVASKSFTLSGWGEPWAPDRRYFTYLFQRARRPQRVKVVARLVDREGPGATGRAGVSIMDSGPNEGGARNSTNGGAWLFASARGVSFEWRPPWGPNERIATVPDLRPPVWLRLERRPLGGELSEFVGMASGDGQRWVRVGSVMIASFKIAHSLTAGLFAGSGDPDALETAAFDDVAVETGP